MEPVLGGYNFPSPPPFLSIALAAGAVPSFFFRRQKYESLPPYGKGERSECPPARVGFPFLPPLEDDS